ncbi:MAG: nucleotidyltransferase domain-containing protein [Candidatus Jordarchaeum sp.]|uniref:nucleotidyltransferase domain-containing protein n=1 Tax=Candidatus Jordarchaeum sp. TaxID=2823881 RepID=UPI004049A4F1
MNLDKKTQVAKEAARLLYYGLASEYYTAKREAAKSLGTKILPSNREIAEELDQLSDMLEGKQKSEYLKNLRKEALQIMKVLKKFNPILIGSVWRGTAHRGSDIDIRVYGDDEAAVIETIKRQTKYTVIRQERTTKTVDTEKKTYLHVFVKTPLGYEAEIVIRPLVDINVKEKCEIFGDYLKGLKLRDLEEIIQNDPLRKFIPY